MPTWTEYYLCLVAPYAPCAGGAGSDSPDRYWDAKLYPYVKSGDVPSASRSPLGGVWRCPSSIQSDTQRTYSLNSGFFYDTDSSSPYSYRYIAEQDMPKPAQVIFAMDGAATGAPVSTTATTTTQP